MFAPQLTEDMFKECLERNLTPFATISKLCAKNCRKDFSKTIPKALREEGHDAHLIILNHKDKWKYMGFNVDNIAGCLHLTTNPDILWAGYVSFGKDWYSVTSDQLLEGRIPHSSKIIFPQIEFDEDAE